MFKINLRQEIWISALVQDSSLISPNNKTYISDVRTADVNDFRTTDVHESEVESDSEESDEDSSSSTTTSSSDDEESTREGWSEKAWSEDDQVRKGLLINYLTPFLRNF